MTRSTENALDWRRYGFLASIVFLFWSFEYEVVSKQGVRLSEADCAPVFAMSHSTDLRLVTYQRMQVEPLVHAHAHNDYEHARPLFDALDSGFTSIEADVYLVDGILLVAHDFSKISKERTLEHLYLMPLSERIQQNNGQVFPNGPSLTLLVDIKRDGVAAFRALNELLMKYRNFVSEVNDDLFVERAITVIVSGERPIAEMAKSNPRFAGVDGRLSDLESDKQVHFMPLISDNWNSHFKYRGEGEMLPEERSKLQELVMKAHRKGRRLRFWATAENERLWQELRNAEVDLIGTDRLELLARFLRRPN